MADPHPFRVTSVGFSMVATSSNGYPHVNWADRSMEAAQDRVRKIHAEQFPGQDHPPITMARTAVRVFAADLVEPSSVDPYAVRVQQFVVCGLPDGHPQWESYAVIATCRGAGWWQVRRGPRVVSSTGEELHPNREDCPEDTPELFMDVDTALRVATDHAKHYAIRGRTAADVLAAGTTTNP